MNAIRLRHFTSACAAVLIGTSAGAQTAPSKDFLLARGRAGKFEIGQPIDEVNHILFPLKVKVVDLDAEGMFTPGIEIRLSRDRQTPSLIAPIREWPCRFFQIQAITVEDARFKTSDGFGIGSTLGQLRRAYPAAFLNKEEGNSAIVQALGMTFGLGAGEFADSTRIISVYLWMHPDSVRKRRCPGDGGRP